MSRLGKFVCVVAVAGSASMAFAQHAGRATRVVTTPEGTFLVDTTAGRISPGLGSPEAILWTFPDPVAIPETGRISLGNVWVGEALNNERLQRFALTGDGTPLAQFPGSGEAPAVTAAARGADLAVFMDHVSGSLELRAYNSMSVTDPLWSVTFPSNYQAVPRRAVDVSYDGSVVACSVHDSTNNVSACYFLNGSDGSERSVWVSKSGQVGAVDLTDNGAEALLTHGSTARVIDTATGEETFSVQGSGAGGAYNISGDGSVLVVGGFSLQVYKKVNNAYQLRINFTAPTSWFGSASAVSRDGSTVGALAHDYGSGYLNTATRIWDVESGELLGTYTTTGTGTFQDSAVGAALSDDGQRLVVASWGDQGNSHPPVMVFDRQVNLVASHTPSGSPMAVDIAPNGGYVLATNKSVHANTFGNGGAVTVIDVPIAGCYANCDGSTTAPVLNVNDFICFQSAFAAGESYANCDQSTSPPVLNVNDFICFQSAFAAGCP